MDDVYVDGEYIVFRLPEDCIDEDYQVALDRCSTPEAICEWVPVTNWQREFPNLRPVN